MTIAVVLAIALVAGAPILGVVAVASATVAPVPFALSLGVLALRGRSRRALVDPRVALLSAMAADLRAGRSLRDAIVSAVGTDAETRLGTAGRRARLGAPIEEVAAILTDGFGAHGPLVGTGLRLVARTGAAGADVLDQAALLLGDDLEVQREVRAGSAPAKVSATVVSLAPVTLVGWQLADGTLARAVSVPGGGFVVGLGAALLASGVAAVATMARRS